MLFNPKDYPMGRYVIHCPTYDDAQNFLEYMAKNEHLSRGEVFSKLNVYKRYGNNTCYRPVHKGCAYGSLGLYRSEGCIILSASDFDFSEDNQLPDISLDSDDATAFDRFISSFI